MMVSNYWTSEDDKLAFTARTCPRLIQRNIWPYEQVSWFKTNKIKFLLESVAFLGSKENYSIYYSKRALDTSRCGDRNNEFDEPRMVGLFGTTRFERIRLDIHTLKVIDDDYTFATSYGKDQKYGTAGDCYGTTNVCPQGDFSINLTGTKFRIRPKTMWEVTGHDSAIQYVVKVSSCFLFGISCTIKENKKLLFRLKDFEWKFLDRHFFNSFFFKKKTT